METSEKSTVFNAASALVGLRLASREIRGVQMNILALGADGNLDDRRVNEIIFRADVLLHEVISEIEDVVFSEGGVENGQ